MTKKAKKKKAVKRKGPSGNFNSGRNDYLQILLEPEHFDLKKDDIAKLLGVTTRTLYNWDKELDWDWIKDERRKKYSSRIAAVDLAMFKKAKTGDTRAAELVYKRFDQWIDTTKVLGDETKTDDELRDMAKAIGEQLSSESKGTGAEKGSRSPRTGSA